LVNAWRVGRNLALMAKIGTGLEKKVIDRTLFYRENDYKSEEVEHTLHTVMASFHFGLWEFLPQVYANIGHNVGVVVAEQKDKTVNRLLSRLRQRNGVLLIKSGREVANRLRALGITGFMLDNTSIGKSTSGRSAGDGVVLEMPEIAFAAGRRLELGVTPVFGYWDKGRLVIRIFGSGDEDKCFAALMKMIKERPADWVFWGKTGRINRTDGEEYLKVYRVSDKERWRQEQ